MMRGISESEWKYFSRLHPIALERFCERALAEMKRTADDASKSYHERYLAVFQFMKKRDREIASAFNDKRRSTALLQLAQIQSHGLLTEDELSQFSPDTRAAIRVISGA